MGCSYKVACLINYYWYMLWYSVTSSMLPNSTVLSKSGHFLQFVNNGNCLKQMHNIVDDMGMIKLKCLAEGAMQPRG